MNWLGKSYHKVYDLVCGQHPNIRPWHFQWLATRDLYSDLRHILPRLSGRVLDVGCGDKPYKSWFRSAEDYVGIDIYAGRKVDIVIHPGEHWPLEDRTFDVVLCTQVLEHTENLEYVLEEIDRVLKPGGRLIVTVPFIYNEHGAPNDYRRLSYYGAKQLFVDRYEIIEARKHGAIGSTLGTLCLNWFDMVMSQYGPLRFLKGLLLPIWIPFCGIVNMLCWLLDKIDGTAAFYNNVCLVWEKPRTTLLNIRQ